MPPPQIRTRIIPLQSRPEPRPLFLEEKSQHVPVVSQLPEPPRLFQRQGGEHVSVPIPQRPDAPELFPSHGVQHINVPKQPELRPRQESFFKVHEEDKILPEKETVLPMPPSDPTTPASKLIQASAMQPSIPTPSFEIQPPEDVSLQQPEVYNPPPKRKPPVSQTIPQRTPGFQWTMEGSDAPRMDFHFQRKRQVPLMPREATPEPREATPDPIDLQQLLAETQQKNIAEQRRLHAERLGQLRVSDQLQIATHKAQARIQAEAEEKVQKERRRTYEREEQEILQQRREEERKHKATKLDLDAEDFLQEMLQVKAQKTATREMGIQKAAAEQLKVEQEALVLQVELEKRAKEESRRAEAERIRIRREQENLKRDKERMKLEKEREDARLAEQIRIAQELKYKPKKKTAEEWFRMAHVAKQFQEQQYTVAIQKYLAEKLLEKFKHKYPKYTSEIAKGIAKGIRDFDNEIAQIAKKVVAKQIVLEKAKEVSFSNFEAPLSAKIEERVQVVKETEEPEKKEPETVRKEETPDENLPSEPAEDSKLIEERELAVARTKSKIEWTRLLKNITREYNQGRAALDRNKNKLEDELEEEIHGTVSTRLSRAVAPILDKIRQTKIIRKTQSQLLRKLLRQYLVELPTTQGKYRDRRLRKEEIGLLDKGVKAIYGLNQKHGEPLKRKHLLWIQGTINPESIQNTTRMVDELKKDVLHVSGELKHDREKMSRYQQMLDLLQKHGKSDDKKGSGLTKHRSRVTAWLSKSNTTRKPKKKKRAKSVPRKKKAGAIYKPPLKVLQKPQEKVPSPKLVTRAPSDFVRRKKRKYL